MIGQFLTGFYIANFLPFFTVASIIVLSLNDESFPKITKIHLIVVSVLIFIMLVGDYFDVTITEFGQNPDGLRLYFLRFVGSSICHFGRPIILFVSLLLIYTPGKTITVITSVPAIINTVLIISNFWTKLVFDVTPDNIWKAGPLLNLNYGIFGLYIGLIILFLFVYWKKLDMPERIAIAISLIIILSSVISDIIRTNEQHSMMFVVAATFLMYYVFLSTRRTNELIRLQKERLELQKNIIHSSQIQPHFIYNTLNTIYGLCETNPTLAQKTILNFSSFLRRNLDYGSADEMIPIENELEHTKFYTSIEEIRFENLNIIYDIHDGGYTVPFLIIQPMVENAIRHGVRGMDNGTVIISLNRDTDKNGKTVHVIEISDNGNGKSKSNKMLGQHTGIGIPNVRERVENIAKGSFDITMSEENGTRVTIKIPE